MFNKSLLQQKKSSTLFIWVF